MKNIKTKTILGLLFLSFNFSYLSLGWAGLGRPLKDKEIAKLKENLEKNPTNVNSRRFLADHYAIQKNWNEVNRLLTPIADSLPEESLLLLIDANMKTRRMALAESLIKIPLSQKKVSKKAYLKAVELYTQKAEMEANKDIRSLLVNQLFNLLKTASHQDPQEVAYYDLQLETLRKFVPHFQYDSLRVLEDMKTNEVTLSGKHYSLACEFNYLAGYSKQAKEDCREAMKQDPDNPKNLIHLGKTYLQAGDHDTAMRMLASVGDKYNKSEEALFNTAEAYYESKDLKKAYEYYKKATQHKDAEARDYLGLAKVSFELKKYEESLAAFTKNCQMTRFLHHEFRLASGLLKDQPEWQHRFRAKMQNCK
ncbi:MAG: tetratricopeptide repeat protein [Bdellovibrionales bacterium]|nr:tetratricopeptide repeat protein [Bdellovibrionales bacterium]